ncbi:MAG: hypothetical protein GF401_00450 [Chitinivibrionales bacterium]|nr:hypothetical protein [Chitinivibrionales bacterium]
MKASYNQREVKRVEREDGRSRQDREAAEKTEKMMCKELRYKQEKYRMTGTLSESIITTVGYTSIFPFSCLTSLRLTQGAAFAAKSDVPSLSRGKPPAIQVPHLRLKRPSVQKPLLGDFGNELYHIKKEFDQEGEDIANGVSGIQAYYFGARYYDAEIGLWFSCDKAGQFINPYAYSTNPILMVDKDGNFFWLIPAVGFTVGYIRHGVTNDQWGWQAVKSGLWTGAAFTSAVYAPGITAGALALNQGVANVAQNKAQGFFPNVGQFFMGAAEGGLDFVNIATLGFANRQISHVSGTIRGHAYNSAQGITGDEAKLNIKEARVMNRTFGNYLGQGSIVKAASDYVWALEGGNYSIGWDERYKYARAKRYYAEGGYSSTNSRYQNYRKAKDIHPSRIEMRSKNQGKWNPQFVHGLGGTLFAHKVWHDGFETYGEPYESFNLQDYSDDRGLVQWYNNYW